MKRRRAEGTYENPRWTVPSPTDAGALRRDDVRRGGVDLVTSAASEGGKRTGEENKTSWYL